MPDETAQRLILLLHAARSIHAHSADVKAAWGDASDPAREQTRALASELDAEVALAAATGELDQYRDRREYDLWRLYTQNQTTTAGFSRIAAEAKAAPADARFVRLRLIGYAVGVVFRMPQRLEVDSGRRPTFREVLAAYGAYVRRATDVLTRRRRQRETP